MLGERSYDTLPNNVRNEINAHIKEIDKNLIVKLDQELKKEGSN